MEWKIFASTFITIFLAEMGDKTQLAALAASSSQQKSTMTIITAVILALALAGTIGVVFGKYLGTVLSPSLLKYLSGGLFIFIGIWVMTAKS